jgi:cell division septum initiation protein DivIVA
MALAHSDDVRGQRGNFQQRVRDMQARLASLDREIQATELYGDIDDDHRSEVADKIQDLKEERKDILLSLQRDIPPETEALKAAEEAAQAQLQAATAQLQATQLAHLQQVQDAWLRTAPALLEPVCAFLQTEGKALDQAWTLLGADVKTCGSTTIRAAILAQFRSR